MKKILSLVLVLTMVLSLCACGNNSKNDSDSLDYTSNSNQISNDTTVVTPDTTGSSAIEYNPTPAEPEDFDLSANYKESAVISEFEKLDLGYKMGKIGQYETVDTIQHFYWVELEDSWKHIYDTYGTMFVEVVDTKDNCMIDSYYENIRVSSESTIIYDTLSRDRNVNRHGFIVNVMEQKDDYFEKNKYNNYATLEDLGFILGVKEYDTNAGGYIITKGQYLEVNADKADLTLKGVIQDIGGLLIANDDYYRIKETNIMDKDNRTSFTINVKLGQLFPENDVDALVLSDTFKFYDEKTMELATFPEGTTISTEIEQISESGTLPMLKFTVSNPNGFSNEFLDQFQCCVLEFDLNGQTYCVITD